MNPTKLSICIFTLIALLQNSTLFAANKISDSRYALLIGNGDYSELNLKGAKGSLDKVEAALKSLGFQVSRHENLNEKELKTVCTEFADRVPTNGIAFVYYYGLAANVNRLGKFYNVLRPVNEKIESDNDYRSRGLSIQDLLKNFKERSGSRVNLLFLDACWESPILPKKGNISAGLRELEVDPNTSVVFSAASTKVIPISESESASALSSSIAQEIKGLERTVSGTLEAISTSLNSWNSEASKAGIGVRSNFPISDSIREGKVAGELYTNSLGISFRWCPPGEFMMGSAKTDLAQTRDRKPVQVQLSKGFWMGNYEVTQGEYNKVLRKNPPLGFTLNRNAPFWGATESKQIQQFCDKLNEIEKKAGRLPSGWEYVCPTEAEWEYACRAGSQSDFCFGDDIGLLGNYANFADNTLKQSNPNYYWATEETDDGIAESLALVGSYRPNSWGICDMHGNVAEIVADHLVAELPGGKDPSVKLEKNGTTQIRGGAWCSLPMYCESSFRNSPPGKDKHNFVGFRIALKRVK
jgi:formylglycine-generating enzyme required for sulfatase activity